MKKGPPHLFLRFFRWFCHPDLLPSIEGDLQELYAQRMQRHGKGRADRSFILDVLLLFRPGIVRPPQRISITNTIPMWRNYLTIGWRNLRRNRGYSLINVGGLTIGMAVALFLGLWVYDELSFDRYHAQYDRTARIIQNITNNGVVETWRNLPYPLADELRQHYADDFELIAMSTGIGTYLMEVEGERSERQGGYYEPGAPAVLGLTMMQGTDALDDPKSILLAAATAKALFGESDALGRPLKLEGVDYKVAGIYADLPANSTFARVAFMAPWKTFYNNEGLKDWEDPWRPNGFHIWVRLKPNADPARVSDRIKEAVLKNLSEQLALKQPQLFLFPMSDWHLRSEFKNGVNTGGAIQYVWLFGLTGVIVLMLACINFMNLSTAQSEKRSREVGIRKAMGSLRGQLVSQFFVEAILIAVVALGMALVVVQLFLPAFNLLVNKQLVIPWMNIQFVLVILGFTLFTGVLAGSYPALFLSSFRPVQVLKGTFRSGRLAGLPRKVLVVVQFSVSVALIIGTWVVLEQIQLGKDRGVGYTREGLISVPMVSAKLRPHFDAFKEEVMKTGEVIAMARATNPTTETGNSSSRFNWKGKDPAVSVDFPFVYVSYEFGATVGWTFRAGRDFSRDFPSDTSALVVNEAAAEYFGFADPIGEVIQWGETPFTIVGVIADMVMDSPYDPVKPTVFALTEDGGYLIFSRVKPGVSPGDALARLESVYKKYAEGDPFNYSFVDADYATKFGSEEKVFRLSMISAVLAIAISCLGIFGLASFVVERRAKEVGIRKVMGAGSGSLWQLLSRDFIALVLISFGLAFPAAWYFATDWLAGYTYRITVEWWVYLASGGIAVAITLATVSYHTVRAALSNPANSLRVE